MRSSAARSRISTSSPSSRSRLALRLRKSSWSRLSATIRPPVIFRSKSAAELAPAGLPEGNRLGIERQLALHARHVLGIEAHEAALHLHVKAAGIGIRAADASVVDRARRRRRPRRESRQGMSPTMPPPITAMSISPTVGMRGVRPSGRQPRQIVDRHRLDRHARRKAGEFVAGAAEALGQQARSSTGAQ